MPDVTTFEFWFGVALTVAILVMWLWGDKVVELFETKKPIDDTNIEWMGPDVCLKKKNYPELKDDHRTGVENETKD